MGVAPYKYVGIWSAPSKAVQEANPNAYNLAMSSRPECCHFSCDHCGTGINNHCIIVDATGMRFAIGTDCLNKLHDVENLSKADADKKAHEKALRKARADKKREEKRHATEVELQRQRDNNDGLTDWELNQKTAQDELLHARKVRRIDAAYFIDALNASGGDFCRDIVRTIENGLMPYGRGRSIVCEIAAKYHSDSKRINSKAAIAELDVAEQKFEEIKEKLA